MHSEAAWSSSCCVQVELQLGRPTWRSEGYAILQQEARSPRGILTVGIGAQLGAPIGSIPEFIGLNG